MHFNIIPLLILLAWVFLWNDNMADRFRRHRRGKKLQEPIVVWAAPDGYPQILLDARNVAQRYYRENYQRFWDDIAALENLKCFYRALVVLLLGAVALSALFLGADLLGLPIVFPWYLNLAVAACFVILVLLSFFFYWLSIPTRYGQTSDDAQEAWLDANFGNRVHWLAVWRDARIYCGESVTNPFRVVFAAKRWSFFLVPALAALSVVPILEVSGNAVLLTAILVISAGGVWLAIYRWRVLFHDAAAISKAPDEYIPLRIMLNDVAIFLDLP
jgi:hypothetical protein